MKYEIINLNWFTSPAHYVRDQETFEQKFSKLQDEGWEMCSEIKEHNGKTGWVCEHCLSVVMRRPIKTKRTFAGFIKRLFNRKSIRASQ